MDVIVISCLRGFLYEIGQESIIIDLNGLGLEVILHQRALAALPPMGESIFLHTHLQVLDNDFKLYGFLEKEELKLFKTLLGVSGMGAKGAMNVLAAMDPLGFYQAIASADEKSLIKIPGIGKKSAGRLIFELQQKIPEFSLNPAGVQGGAMVDEVLQALESLGYSRSEVYSLIIDLKQCGELSDRVEENLKKVLKYKARQMK
ncbi:MAG: Holliday junction branch migration protein RuvA [Syntrophomonadaceae bacterium]|nr:Holliday junction branch migration protein RuvA [Syntrophomonadaceae bacterium]